MCAQLLLIQLCKLQEKNCLVNKKNIHFNICAGNEAALVHLSAPKDQQKREAHASTHASPLITCIYNISKHYQWNNLQIVDSCAIYYNYFWCHLLKC